MAKAFANLDMDNNALVLPSTIDVGTMSAGTSFDSNMGTGQTLTIVYVVGALTHTWVFKGGAFITFTDGGH